MDNRISIIGVGKLGLCLGLNLERKGFVVTGVDSNSNYIASLANGTYTTAEPHINEYLASSKNISFTSDLQKALESDVIFVVVSTPSTVDWKYDHTQIETLANSLMELGVQKTRKDLVINCTTFPGYCDTLQEKLKSYNYYVSYNPEFIAQGTIIKDQVNCDSVLIGEADQYAGQLISSIYSQMVESQPTYCHMSRTEAELTKLSINCYLTTKISYANMVGDIAYGLGCDADKVLQAIGADSRIGGKYLKPGFGFGGPCFPRDNRALAKCGEEVGVDALISKATDLMNEKHLEYQIQRYMEANPDPSKTTLIMDFVTYKKDSVLIEESQQLKFALKLKDMGYKVVVLDTRKEVINQIEQYGII